MDATTKTRESILREIAAKQGFDLIKSHGTYGIVRITAPGGNWRSRELMAGDHHTGFGLTLDDVENALVIDE